MEDDFGSVISEKVLTALKLLDLAFHLNTGDGEALAAINAYRRISKGMIPSILFERHYAGIADPLMMEEQWQENFAIQEIELNRLRNEIRRLTKSLKETQRRRQRQTENGTNGTKEPKPKEAKEAKEAKAPKEAKEPIEAPDLTISDVEWSAIHSFIPSRYRNEKGRVRISMIIARERDEFPWRVFATDDKPDGWTTYYNQLQSWRKKGWWDPMMEHLRVLAEQ